jgi:hypothetical protein
MIDREISKTEPQAIQPGAVLLELPVESLAAGFLVHR